MYRVAEGRREGQPLTMSELGAPLVSPHKRFERRAAGLELVQTAQLLRLAALLHEETGA